MKTSRSIAKMKLSASPTLTWWFVVMGISLVGISSEAKKKSSTPIKDELEFVAGDEKSNEVKAVKAELLVSRSEARALGQLQDLIKKYRNTAVEPEMQFRLAELYMRRSKSARFFELNRQSSQVIGLLSTRALSSSSKREIRKAIDTYQQLRRRFPQFESYELVLFNEAFAQQQLGETSAAKQLYFRLIHEFPKSVFIPDCYVALGEMSFNEQNYQVALEHFLQAKKYPDSRSFSYAAYKAGWSQYNLHNAAGGLKELEQVIGHGRKVRQSNLDARLDLSREALVDMTTFYEDVYPADKAFSYFSEQASPWLVGPTVMRMADLYKRHDRHRDLQVVLLTFIEKAPEQDEIPKAHYELVMDYEKIRDRQAAVEQLKKFGTVCMPKSKWSLAKIQNHKNSQIEAQKNPEQAKMCAEDFSEVAVFLAGKWHSRWLKTKLLDLQASAESAYQIYLDHPDGRTDAKVRFKFAELLFQAGKFRAASEHYARVASEVRDSNLSHDAGYASLVSLEKSVADKWSDADEKLFIQYANLYEKQHPKGPYRTDIAFKKGFIAYEKGRYGEAKKVFQQIGWSQSAAQDQRIKAQDLYLDILNLSKSYSELKNSTKSLLDQASDKTSKTQVPMSLVRKKHLTEIYRQSYFYEIQGLENSTALDKARTEYQKFAQENPSSPLAESAIWNALQIDVKTSAIANVASLGFQFAKSFPNSSRSHDALILSAQAHEKMGRLNDAAQVLKKLAEVDRGNSSKWGLLAADYLRLQGHTEEAEKLAIQSGNSPQNERLAAQILFQILESSESSTVKNRLTRWFESKNIEPWMSQMRLRQAQELFDRKQFTQAFELGKKIIGSTGQVPIEIKAEARWIQAQILDQEFQLQNVKSRPDRIALVLALKTEKLEKAQKAYRDVMSYGVASFEAKSYQALALCYRHYSQAIRSITLPPDTPAEEAKAFSSEMDRLAMPLEEQGIESLAQALARAKKYKIYDGSIGRLTDELDRLNLKSSGPTYPIVVYEPKMNIPAFLAVGGAGP